MDLLPDFIKDCLTGKMIPNIGAEENKQMFIDFLLKSKGYSKEDLVSDYPINFDIDDESYTSKIDLLVKSGGRPMIAVRCVAGSMASAEREIISAARIACDDQIPIALSTDGKDTIIYDVYTGRVSGRGFDSVPSSDELWSISSKTPVIRLEEAKLAKMRIIFKTYDMENINRA